MDEVAKAAAKYAKIPERSLLELGFTSRVVDGWEELRQPEKDNLYDLIKDMITNRINTNVTIGIGTSIFECHMTVLQCYSEFFIECKKELQIQLPEKKVTARAFQLIYDWMLAADTTIQPDSVLEILNAAKFLRIEDLIKQCWVCLDNDVYFQEEKAFLVYLEARKYGFGNQEHIMLTRICKYFLTLVASKEYLLLEAPEVCYLLSLNTIGVNTEIEIFMSVVRWLNGNWSEREACLLTIVKCVRFGLIPAWFLLTLSSGTNCAEVERVACYPEVKKMISDGVAYITAHSHYSSTDKFHEFLRMLNMEEPLQRQWIFDKNCSYHHRPEQSNDMENITYESFEEYLNMIRTEGKDNWKDVEIRDETCMSNYIADILIC